MQMWNDPLATDAEKAEFAVNAWIEADNLEAALNRHTCDIEKAMLFQGREYLFKSVISNPRGCILVTFLSARG
jgi:hypothetical protein